MVLTLQEQAQAHILAGLEDDSCKGMALVLPTDKIDRIRLAAWTIDECAGDPDDAGTEPDEFRSLYVTNQLNHARAVRHVTLRVRAEAQRRHLSDRVLAEGTTTLPSLRQANYANLRTVVRLTGQFAPDSLELLILDERQPGEMAQLLPLVQRAQPLFLLVIARRVPPADWPWHYLGEPRIVRGPDQTPSPKKAAEDPPPGEPA